MNNLFPPRTKLSPLIYAYEDEAYPGLLKVGYTTSSAAKRVAQQYPTQRPGGKPYKIVLEESALRSDGTAFTDRDVHAALIRMGIKGEGGEWFRCGVDEVLAAINSVRLREDLELSRSQSFALRPEQREAVEKTAEYFRSFIKENPNKTPHFLWNAKMRFGKTFTAYKLAEAMGWTKILVLTFKPAVKSAWEEDLKTHVDFKNWQFVSKGYMEGISSKKPLVCFGSFQDFLGKNTAGGIKTKNEWVHNTKWDCIILDEYHYGAWRENAKDLFEAEIPKEQNFAQGEGLDYFDEQNMPIHTKAYLYLSGTPFRAISTGEFIEEQIYNWTYSDEQKAKIEWKGDNNPYLSLPRMVLLTYEIPDAIRGVASQGEFNEFDLNEFFAAEGEGAAAHFKHESEVQKWLDLIRGSYAPGRVDNLKLGSSKPLMPFSDSRMLELLTHTFWFLPRVASCHAMKNLLQRRQNTFYRDYKIIVAAGAEGGIGAEALFPVQEAMEDPLKTKTITLSCGKLTTGVSIKPWTGIFMLRSTSSPETYFQAAFRVQTPWSVSNPDGFSPDKEEILKHECYVFDFAPNRALRQIAEYSCRLNVNESNPEKNVADFISFLPVLAYDGSSMKEINAAGVLDMALSGTSATLLARRWESALLVNVDNTTLEKILANQEALDALMRIEGFRTLNSDIEAIINKTETVRALKQKSNEKELTDKEKATLTAEEKEYITLRRQIQEKLIKFATRIPVFMYLTDYREYTLKDVITELEPQLFKKVTGLDVKDFELLVSLNVFNSALMNDAVYKFKRYEDSSLHYTGVVKHPTDTIGLYDTVLKTADK